MTTDTSNWEAAAARAEFYLCLARAFMPPMDPATATAMADALPEDLAELARQIGYGIDGPLARYRDEMARVQGEGALLQIYSALFLSPPRAAQINVGIYLDGAVNGGSVKEMEEAYRRCGVERSEDFHDLSDHVAVQLEFVAFLYAQQAERISEGSATQPCVEPGAFLGAYAARWLPRLIEDLEKAHAERELDANPYLPLAQLLQAAVATDAVVATPDEKQARHERAMAAARAKYAERGIGPEEMAEIARKLRERGLSTDHLAIPVELRDAEKGWEKKQPPEARRKPE